ncbi:MAG TPA: excinuclease ABC subunit UvrC, partial [Saprospiraceae bacterium]|nr:excinuclease ABC subunit UvrC [Saprospiraceae bacterium]
KEEMQVQAERLNFEKAQALKEKLTVFENYQSKSTVVSTNIKDLDVFSIKLEEQIAFVNYLKIIDGAIIHAQTSEMTMNLNHDKKQLLAFAIPILRKRFESMAQEIVVPFELLLPQKDIQITIPSIGDKKKLLDLSEKNLKYFIHQKQRKATEYASRQTSTERILTTLQKDLGIKDLPTHIECFDNSNIMGTNPVSSCVVFKNAKPSKKDYRHYNVKTVEGPNDFASMEEVVYRRYKRLLDEQQSLPQLILIDGGKGQLSAAVASLKKLDLYGKVTIVGIAKRLEELYFPGESIPLHISKKSESLKLIQHARNESHRFAINFHRLKRSKAMLHSELHDIPGIGQKSIEKLLAHFGSVKKIRESNLEEWEKVVGKAIAGKLNAYFSN